MRHLSISFHDAWCKQVDVHGQTKRQRAAPNSNAGKKVRGHARVSGRLRHLRHVCREEVVHGCRGDGGRMAVIVGRAEPKGGQLMLRMRQTAGSHTHERTDEFEHASDSNTRRKRCVRFQPVPERRYVHKSQHDVDTFLHVSFRVEQKVLA